MELRRLTATFGALNNRTLVFDRGLHLIHAPNESGKTTWCAFLRAMLYGLPTRDRGPAADKNRYAPWSGAAMEGRMDLIAGGESLTILRRTRSPSAPMGTFSACYTDTDHPVPGLDALRCGQYLTGVSREVYERSAFIAQNQIPIAQSPDLERRITALMTTGEEDTSCTEAAEQLKKYLTRRRYHKTGLLPAVEEEMAALERQLSQSQSLQCQIAQAEAALPELEQQERQLSGELLIRERTVSAEQRQQLEAAQEACDAAGLRTALCRQETAGLPPLSQLAALKSAAGSVQVNRLTADSLRRRLEQRQRDTAAAQESADAFPLFAGLTAEEAQSRAEADQRTCLALRRRKKLSQALFLLSLLFLLLTALPPLLRRPIPLPLTAAGSALFLLTLAAGAILHTRARRRLLDLTAAYGSGSFTRLSDAYAAAYELLTDCQRREQEIRQRLDALTAAMAEAEEEILSAARGLDSAVSDLSQAAAAIDCGLACWNRLAEAQQEQALWNARREALAGALPEPDAAETEALAALRAHLEEVRQHLTDQRRALSAAQGQLQLTGSPASLAAALEEKRLRRDVLQGEYDAAQLALEALTRANTALQSRFAPALGKKSAKYFAKLTAGKYNTVLLNRDLAAAVQETDSPAPRPSLQLSRGAADQLYLAVRLAICDLLLPEPQSAPLILDDALSAFDDERMALALDVLLEIAQHRQILLFTCHAREGDYLCRAHPGEFRELSLTATQTRYEIGDTR